MDLNPSIFRDIGFNHVRERLAKFSHSPLTQIELMNLEPSNNLPLIKVSQEKSDDLLKALQSGETFPLEQFDPLDEIFQSLKINGKALSPEIISILYKILCLSLRCHTFLKHKINASWQKDLNRFYLNQNGVKKIESIFDEEWDVKDSASKELKIIRAAKRKVEASLDRTMASCFERAKQEGLLHENHIQFFDKRKVLSISAAKKRKIDGAIYGQSQTGKAVYIEPVEVMNIRNELQELHFRESMEINRILLQLSDVFRPDLEHITTGYSALVELDMYCAKATLAKEMDGVMPEFSDIVEIIQGSNPILYIQGKPIIPLDLKMDPGNKCLLITGPNAGGKTVVLKTIGLFALMAQSGLHVPAERVSLPFFDSMFSDIGDHQSIENDLSTFSAHLQGITHILDESTENSLVLMDELGTGTDPDAGAALSQAILENLIERKVWVYATTHLGRLKLWAQKEDGILNARMFFDQNQLKPLYQLKTGKPGSSFALEIAGRMNMSNLILERAKQLLGNKALRVEELLTELERERREVSNMKSRMNRQRKYINEAEERIQDLQEKAEIEYQTAEQKALDEVHDLILETRKDTEKLIDQIRSEQADELSVKQARQRLDERLRDVGYKKEKGKRRKEKGKGRKEKEVHRAIKNKRLTKPKFEIKKGMTVEIPQYNSSGVVLQEANKKGSILIEMNGKQLRLHIDEVFPMKVQKMKPKKTSTDNSYTFAQPSSLQLDIRGKRVDEGIEAVTQFLDSAVVSGLNSINILHGTGTGALQEAVSILLKELTYVKKFHFERPEAGGAGITIVELK